MKGGGCAVMAAFRAHVIIDSLIREFSGNVTHIDLGVVFILGLVSGAAFGLAFMLRRRQSDPR